MTVDQSLVGVAFLVGFALVLFLLERVAPLRAAQRPLPGRLFVNLVLSALALAVAALLGRPAIEHSLGWLAAESFGLVRLVEVPTPLRVAASILLLDLSFYYWHVVNHRVPLLWRFHNVHHIDPDLDVSTALRFHFGEIAYSAGFRIAQIVLIGVSPGTFVAYELAFQANTLFHHSNVRLPIRLERGINKLLVTPRMHGIHHSQVRNETNSNYGVVFSWWDRLHRTLALNVPQSAISIGIPSYSRPDDNRLWNALWLPFRKQRDYWRRPDESLVARDQRPRTSDRRRLAE